LCVTFIANTYIAPDTFVTALQLAKRCRALAEDKKATDVTILHLTELSSIADYFVIASAQSEPQLKAIATHLEVTLKEEENVRPSRVDGYPMSQWVIVDYGDVMVHLFHEDKRDLYSLEELWGDAKRVK
jgi:ribosome-associated protein